MKVHSEELSEPNFSEKKIETLSDTLEVNNLYTVIELYIVKVLKELFKELRGEFQLRLLQPNEPSGQCIRTRSDVSHLPGVWGAWRSG